MTRRLNEEFLAMLKISDAESDSAIHRPDQESKTQHIYMVWLASIKQFSFVRGISFNWGNSFWKKFKSYISVKLQKLF